MTDLPTIITKDGLVPTPPAEIRSIILASVSGVKPGYTADLPASLIEDIASTDVAAVAQMDSARVETVNSLTPYAANAFLLLQLGNLYGVEQNPETLTSVFVQFDGPAGFVIARGFTVSDGTYQYTVQDGGIIGEDGLSDLLFCLATQPGIWTIPAGTVTNIVTSVPSGTAITCNNPQPGIPAADAETEESYRSAVLTAGLVASTGMPSMLKTLLREVDGVQPRLISARAQTGGGWEIICGGGDPYKVAYAIYSALFDISTLVGSVISVTGYTKANPGVITTDLNHGLSNGDTAEISGSLVAAYNGTGTVTVISEKTFSIGVNSTGFATYTGGGEVSPNNRNVSVSINDYPDTYIIPIVSPPQQTVSMTVTWNTSSPNFVSEASVAQLGAAALLEYVNSVQVGAPMNLFVMETIFQTAISSILPRELLTRLVFAVSINGVSTPPSAGTGIIAGDPESYFFASLQDIDVSQG